ncbi:MAG: outer membrane homotrimeric porin [Desulfovibrio sp.]|nr:outer membrane homotrimeric porin [Desulfovibrio sp.]
MRRVLSLLLAAVLVAAWGSCAQAVDFAVKGQWLMGFGVGDGHLIAKKKERGGESVATNADDKFNARQRVRVRLDAVASENLSGTVHFEMGDSVWGKAGRRNGAALGADATDVIELKHAFLDWTVPQTALKFRMGIQAVTLPNKAGGSPIMDDDVAGIVASYKFNDNVALTALWMRPINDNFNDKDKTTQTGYLDNTDILLVSLPLTFDGFEATPWFSWGMAGKHAIDSYNDNVGGTWYHWSTMLPEQKNDTTIAGRGDRGTSKAYGTIIWAGLPLAVTALDPWNFELDLNYGYYEAMGRFDAIKHEGTPDESVRRASSQRQGWLAKALIEYKLDWGIPGIFGWYASGDDGNVKNGSERMPALSACGNFTSFMGDGPYAWSAGASTAFYDQKLNYAGTWGIGARISDMKFLEDLKTTFTVAWWGGTNSPAMVKYMDHAYDWYEGSGPGDWCEGPYLTTNDGLLEFNLISTYKIYENLNLVLDLGYIANFMDNSTWSKTNSGKSTSFEKQDAWKAAFFLAYNF